ncbi:unnamed protein product [Peniophora sp. CBMAI 1063]|nr:unnamed protein product [Peniophora sp. CBMAI 1063]
MLAPYRHAGYYITARGPISSCGEWIGDQDHHQYQGEAVPASTNTWPASDTLVLNAQNYASARSTRSQVESSYTPHFLNRKVAVFSSELVLSNNRELAPAYHEQDYDPMSAYRLVVGPTSQNIGPVATSLPPAPECSEQYVQPIIHASESATRARPYPSLPSPSALVPSRSRVQDRGHFLDWRSGPDSALGSQTLSNATSPGFNALYPIPTTVALACTPEDTQGYKGLSYSFKLPESATGAVFPSDRLALSTDVGVERGYAHDGRRRRKVDKMHSCEVCGKAFPRPSAVKTHMNSHSGARRA